MVTSPRFASRTAAFPTTSVWAVIGVGQIQPADRPIGGVPPHITSTPLMRTDGKGECVYAFGDSGVDTKSVRTIRIGRSAQRRRWDIPIAEQLDTHGGISDFVTRVPGWATPSTTSPTPLSR
jgi:hypothetical protein